MANEDDSECRKNRDIGQPANNVTKCTILLRAKRTPRLLYIDRQNQRLQFERNTSVANKSESCWNINYLLFSSNLFLQFLLLSQGLLFSAKRQIVTKGGKRECTTLSADLQIAARRGVSERYSIDMPSR